MPRTTLGPREFGNLFVSGSNVSQFAVFISQDPKHVAFGIHDSEKVGVIKYRELLCERKQRNPFAWPLDPGPP